MKLVFKNVTIVVMYVLQNYNILKYVHLILTDQKKGLNWKYWKDS